jgi:hypothetical protein
LEEKAYGSLLSAQGKQKNVEIKHLGGGDFLLSFS